jgi:spore coat protein U-like protein
MFSRARIVTLVLLAAAVVVLAAGTAQAQTLNGNFQVTASVAKSCTMTAPASLAFGAYDSFTQAQVDAQANLTIRCTRATVASISLSDGGNFVGTRRMAVGSEYLGYELYSNSTRTQRWGSSGAEIFAWTATNSSSTNLPIYGRIPASQDAAAGAYQDTIQVTVNY